MSDLYQEFTSVLSGLIDPQVGRLLVAVSGGVDSMTLLDLLRRYREDFAPTLNIQVAHFNHQLRQQASQEADLVKAYCLKSKLAYHEEVWLNPVQTNLEAEARQARYQFFADLASQEGIQVLLTGHHKNDAVETSLIRLIRGSSLKGMGSIRVCSRQTLLNSCQEAVTLTLLRPLLTFTKDQLYQYAIDQALPFLEDASNQTRAHLRNRIRLDILPALLKENPQLPAQIASNNLLMQDSYDLHREQLTQLQGYAYHFEEGRLVINRPVWLSLSPTAQRLYLQILLEEYLAPLGVKYKATNQTAILKLLQQELSPNARLDLADNYQARREYGCLYIEPKEPTSQHLNSIYVLDTLNQWLDLSVSERVGLFESDSAPRGWCLSFDKQALVGQKLYLRHRQTGDRIRFQKAGRIYHKKINRLFIDDKWPRAERERAWLLCTDREVLAVLGHYVAAHPYLSLQGNQFNQQIVYQIFPYSD